MPGKNRARSKNKTLPDLVPRLPKEAPMQKSKSVDELLGLTKQQLKAECRKRGQKCTGNKQELLQRLGYKMATKRKEGKNGPNTNGSIVQNNVNSKTTKNVTNEAQRRQRERLERESIILWKKPILTLEYFFRECVELVTHYGRNFLENRKLVALLGISVLSLYLLVNMQGPHHAMVQGVYKKVLWCLYWMGLGILSSVGLGTGLHTFLLYLGPHIAAVTLAGYECGSLNFPEPPYPEEIVCPADGEEGIIPVTILSIMSKVRLEAMCWGAGTALGELPPYFMARASRLSGIEPDDEDDDLKEFEELQKKQQNREKLSIIEKGKLFVEDLVQKVGFFGILACASIPNPLFDLAGITCGHFLVPFWTFFGATLIGKAIIKMHIQKLFVIIAFNETLIETVINYLALVPVVGKMLQTPFKGFMDGQKDKLHKKANRNMKEGGGNLLGKAFELFVIAMIVYFVVSIVNSFAQSYHKRIHKRKNSKAKD
ncbi:vacuole membrane protein 1 isoform X1 [Euwallacea fornicatus]|uniref:vacuole membrane protein 1 isoform X1 n=2 Tax=Euwallacea fornicatus TaxID=995702 RepID=UPI00338E2880